MENTREKLKILAFSDVHGDKQLIASLHKKAEEEQVDLVLICGDFTDYKEEATEGLIKTFLDKKTPVAIMSGNHEDSMSTAVLSDIYGITHLHGRSISYKGVGIFGSGGTTQIGPHRISEREMADNLKAAHDRISYCKKKIMVTHEHPSESSFELDVFPGSKSIKEAVTQFKPDILLCGHIHECEGVEEIIDETRVINVSKRGRIIEL
ncbi:hypothetical protein GF342_04560 [Candidatus Woesearchaeota archaeon]|nr:hypothetical protein [Candidatus Woesearchaeota archaeon]